MPVPNNSSCSSLGLSIYCECEAFKLVKTNFLGNVCDFLAKVGRIILLVLILYCIINH